MHIVRRHLCYDNGQPPLSSFANHTQTPQQRIYAVEKDYTFLIGKFEFLFDFYSLRKSPSPADHHFDGMMTIGMTEYEHRGIF